jgi:hypothetical protein
MPSLGRSTVVERKVDLSADFSEVKRDFPIEKMLSCCGLTLPSRRTANLALGGAIHGGNEPGG